VQPVSPSAQDAVIGCSTLSWERSVTKPPPFEGYHARQVLKIAV